MPRTRQSDPHCESTYPNAASGAAGSLIDAEVSTDATGVAMGRIARFAPGWVAFHGKGAAVEVSRALGHGRVVHVGRQQWRVGSSRVFVLPSASRSNRSLANLEGKASRLGWFREFRRVLPRPTATVVRPEAQAARSEQLAGADTHPLSFDDNG